jgi:hypothetical protein
MNGASLAEIADVPGHKSLSMVGRHSHSYCRAAHGQRGGPDERCDFGRGVMQDWRNPADYDYLLEDAMTPERWAWEFLRRNPDYRREWDQLLANGEANRIMRKEGLLRKSPDLYIPAPESKKWELMAYDNPKIPYPKGLRFRQSFGRVITGKLLLAAPAAPPARHGGLRKRRTTRRGVAFRGLDMQLRMK